MNKDDLHQYVDLYTTAEQEVSKLDSEFGIRIWDSPKNNFYNKYTMLIHFLLVELFGEEKAACFEDYCLDNDVSNYMTFDDLFKYLTDDVSRTSEGK